MAGLGAMPKPIWHQSSRIGRAVPTWEYIGKPALSATAVGVGSHDRTQAEYVLNYCFPQ